MSDSQVETSSTTYLTPHQSALQVSCITTNQRTPYGKKSHLFLRKPLITTVFHSYATHKELTEPSAGFSFRFNNILEVNCEGLFKSYDETALSLKCFQFHEFPDSGNFYEYRHPSFKCKQDLGLLHS